ncbi:unnamed protein product [Lampetra planeri]
MLRERNPGDSLEPLRPLHEERSDPGAAPPGTAAIVGHALDDRRWMLGPRQAAAISRRPATVFGLACTVPRGAAPPPRPRTPRGATAPSSPSRR